MEIIRNLGTVRSKGVELTTAVKPVSHLTVTGSMALNDARFAAGTYDLNYARTPPVCDNVVCPENGYIGGRQTPNSSKWQANLGFEWKDAVPFGTELQYYGRADAAYQSKQYDEDINLSWISARTVVNASVGLTGVKWEVQLWARNLFNREYVASVLVGAPNQQYNGYLGDRQTLGVTGKYRF